MTVKVRRGEYADIPWLVEQALEFAKFTSTEADPAYLPLLAKQCIDTGLVLVAYNSDTQEKMGMLAASMVPHTYCPSKTMLVEIVWWVPRNFRHSTAGAALLLTYMNWGRRHADIVTLSTMSNSPVNPASLTKRGFRQKEQAWILEN